MWTGAEESRTGFDLPRADSPRRRVCALALLVVVAALTPGGAAPDASGVGFGNGGWYGVAEPPVWIWPQRDGKIVVALASDRVDLLRLLADGRPDPSFGTSGSVSGQRIPCSLPCGRTQIAVQPDGGFVIAQESTLSRRLADGRLDRNFGVRGRVDGGPARISGIAVAPDGSIVTARWRPDQSSAMLARYLPDGSVDASFGSNGKQTVNLPAPVRVAVQPDGKIVVAALNGTLVRYLADGSSDEAFGTHGTAAAAGLGGDALALRPDGRIVVAGLHAGVTEVAQFLPDGRLDPQFGKDGIAQHEYSFGLPEGVAVAPDGSVVVVGTISLGSAYKGSHWLAALVSRDGRWKDLEGPPCSRNPDPEYPSDVYEWASGAAVQADGKVLLGGFGCDGAVIGRYAQSLALDAGPQLRVIALADRGRLLRRSVNDGVLHLLGTLQTSDAASVAVTVQRAQRAVPCKGGARLQLQAGTRLGTKRLATSASLLRSSTRGGTRTPYHISLSLRQLRDGTIYSIRLHASDARQRTDEAKVVFTVTTSRSATGTSHISIHAHLQTCPR
jgi:uncharacterized delta-60 repeat protein